MATFKSPVLLLLLTLFLSSAFLSLGFHLRSPRKELSELLTESNNKRDPEHCQQRCQKEQGPRRQQCQQQCEDEEEEDDPRQQYEQCQESCRRKRFDMRRQQQCQQRCQKEYEERQEEDPRRQYEQCRERCEGQQGDERQQRRCQQRCRREFEKRKEEEERHSDNSLHPSKEESGESEQEQRSNNPFLFRSRTFQCPFSSEHGRFFVVPRFNRKSQLLRGIEDYRLSILEAEANTFVIPHHCDSESLYFGVRGRATITLVNDERRLSFYLKSGNVIWVPAGTTVYIVNAEREEKLVLAILREPVNVPGRTREFFLSGGHEYPEAYLEKFSARILESSLNCQKDQIEKLFSGQRQRGMIRNASREQLSALSADDSSSPRHSESCCLIELLNRSPLHSNENGRLVEASPAEFKQLRNMDVSVFALQMSKYSSFVPHVNSKQTDVVVITKGSLEIQIIIPKLPRQRQEEQREEQEDEDEDEEEQEQEQRRGRYQRVTARAKAGDIVVIPADFPVAWINSGSENVNAIGFGINAENNRRIFLAGRKNVVKNMEREAQELSFGVPAELVDEVFNNQEESYFVSASQQGQQREEDEDKRENRLSSILDIARLF